MELQTTSKTTLQQPKTAFSNIFQHLSVKCNLFGCCGQLFFPPYGIIWYHHMVWYDIIWYDIIWNDSIWKKKKSSTKSEKVATCWNWL